MLVSACAQTPHRPPQQSSATELPARLDAYFARYAAARDFAGVVLVAHEVSTIFEKAYGKADLSSGAENTLNTQFRVASVSKTFTGAAVAILAAQGKVRLEDHLSKYLPGFPHADSITLRDLLLHRSGVGQVAGAEIAAKCLASEEVLERIARAPRLFEPGANSSYSNEGFFILAVTVEKVSGKPFGTFLEENLFGPLRMEGSGTFCSSPRPAGLSRGHILAAAGLTPLATDEPAMMGAGSVYSTARDLLTWMQSLRRGDLLAISSLEYPYGWGKRNYGGHPLIEQTGILSGFTAHIALYGDDETYAIVLSNVRSGMVQRLASDLHSLIFGNGDASAPPELPLIHVPPDMLASFEGNYRSQQIPVPLHIRVQNGQLTSHWGDDPVGMVWLPVGDNEFFTRQEYGRAHFELGSSGAVTGATIAWPQGTLSFVRSSF